VAGEGLGGAGEDVVDLAEAGGVDEEAFACGQGEGYGEEVSGGAGECGDDAAVDAGKCVGEAAFSGVCGSGEDDLGEVIELLPGDAVVEEALESVAEGCELLA